MKHIVNINAKRMLILFSLKKRQKDKRCLNLTVYIFLEKHILQEYGNLVPCCVSPPAFRMIVLCRFPEAPRQGMPLAQREKRKKQLKPEGSAGAVKQVVPFPLRLKTTANLCVGLEPMCLAMNNWSQLELMKRLSANLTINHFSNLYYAWVADSISVWIKYT